MTTNTPFEITERDDGKSVEIRKTASYTPDPDKQVYFDIELEVTDNAQHAERDTIKIVIMTGLNNVTFGFDNARGTIDSKKDELINTLDEVFDWSFSSKGIKGGNTRADDGFTTLEGSFVDPNQNYKPLSQPEIATRYDREFDRLWTELKFNLNITLDSTRQGHLKIGINHSTFLLK